jgi:dUTP pyrophosphatase
VRPGDRIAQAMIVPVPDVTFELVAEQLSITERGAGGMGSTGA